MRTKYIDKGWPISTVVRRKSKINPKPQYQRTPVWNKQKRQLLIDSILRGYDLPKFYLRSSDSEYEHEVVDGQQRLIAIWKYRNDEFELGKESHDILEYEDLTNSKFSDLPSDVQDQFEEYRINLVVIEEANDVEIRQLFLRLQEGVSLTPTEKRNAMIGNMRDFIADLGDNHKVFEVVNISNIRYQYHELAAIVTCLEIAGRPIDVKAPSLKKMYKDNVKDFSINGSFARKVRQNLNFLARVLKNRPPEMNVKWGFVDLYLLISKINESYVISNREGDIEEFFIEFEKERRANIKNPSQLLGVNKNFWNKELYDYIEAFIRSGGTEQNIEKRHKVYMNRFLKEVQNIVPKDPQRTFTIDERIVIWRRDNETCQECKKKIAFKKMQADHIKPHSNGGQTTLDNAQTLCQQCNAKKGAA